jgi:OOP family OmpA-OmpF porin
MNLIEGALSYIRAGAIDKASALVGESPASTRKAVEVAAPTVVAGLADKASSTEGAEDLMRVVEDAGLLESPARVSDRLNSASGDELVGLGKDMLGHVFGGRLSGVADAAAAESGVKPSSMTSLLGLTAPLVFGALGGHVHTHRLDAAGLAALLGAQRSGAMSSLPDSVVAALAPAPVAEPLPPPARKPSPQVRSVAAAPDPRRFWPLLLLIPLAILGGLFFRRGTAPAPREWVLRDRLGVGIAPEGTVATPPAPIVAEPKPEEVTLPGGAIGYDLAQFLANPGDATSKRFVFDHLNFEFATANLTPESLPTLDRVAEVLKAYPTTEILLEGHTDATGVPVANERLSLERANAVKSALAARGIAADRIATAGIGQDRPVASNDTEEGRARNRRTELVVTKR